MPPKQAKVQDKAKQAAKAKSIEDKTFGLKNKNKSKAVQQYVNQMQKSAAANSNSSKAARIAAQQGAVNPKDKKKAEEEKQKELNALFAVAIKQPKVPPGVDPKSVVCEFYRHGQCTKGFKCKFSHDLSVEKKSHKIDLFTDQRELGPDGEPHEEGMEDWDQETLERVVKEKHANEKPSNATNIICKFFLEAVEKHQYGWFWKCPNGADCKYRHALPPGYVLKSQMKELLEEEARNTKDVAEQIEEERAKIEARTPITQEVFAAWRSRKVEARRKQKADEEEERKRKGIMTGREIFLQEGFTVEDDAGASADDDYRREGQDEEEAAIAAMLQQAREAAERARQRALTEPSSLPTQPEEGEEEEEEEEDGGGPSGARHDDDDDDDSNDGNGGAAGPSTHLQLDDDEHAAVFDDDDDDDDDIDDDELDELEQSMTAARVSDSNGAGPSTSSS